VVRAENNRDGLGGCVVNNNKDCLAGFYGRLDRSGARGLWKRDLALAIGIAIVIGIAGMAISAPGAAAATNWQRRNRNESLLEMSGRLKSALSW
jgi:hypothetical protein